MGSLPDLIEIIPPGGRIQAEVTVPGSKSITNRALIVAALTEGITVLKGALWSEDTQVMVDCLKRLGYEVHVGDSAGEPANRTITVEGRPEVPGGGTMGKPLELFVGNAGTAARFLTAFVTLGHGVYQISGVPRMHERPQGELFSALRQLGYSLDSSGDHLPVIVTGGGRRNARCEVSLKESSQFASALLLVEKVSGWHVEVVGENQDEAPYVAMTREILKSFSSVKGSFEVEADASSASYFVAANYLLSRGGHTGDQVRLLHAPESNWQVDGRFRDFLPLAGQISRARDLGDSILTSMVLAPFADAPVRFIDLARLRVQECDRVHAMKEGLLRCGAKVEEEGDMLVVHPSVGQLHGAEIETWNDHRIAMCFAVLGLVVPGIKLGNPACVKKTFPNFFQKLALPQPSGLGIVIRHGRTGDVLQPGDLFAE